MRLNARIDAIMGALFIATTFSWRNYWSHIALGIALVVAVAGHLWLHRRWFLLQARRFVRPGDRPLSIRTRLDLLVDASIGALFLVSVISGSVIGLTDSAFWTGLHSASSWAMFLGCIVHLTTHAGWVVRNVRRAVPAHPT